MFNQNLENISAESSDALRIKLRRINVPHGIISIYFDGKNHVAWVKTDRPFSNKLRAKLNRKVNVEANKEPIITDATT